MPELAKGENYWGSDGFPVTARRVGPGVCSQHSHDLTHTPHLHDFAELVLISSGSGVQRIDGVSYPVAAGDVFLLSGYTEHFFEDSRELEHYNVMFDPDKLPLPMAELAKMPGFHAFFVLEPACRRQHRFKSRLSLDLASLEAVECIVRQIIDEDKAALPGADAAKCALLSTLLVTIARSYQGQELSKGKSASLLRLGKLLGALESRSVEAWTLAKMAKLAGMSKSNLMLLFKKASSESPRAYLLGLRLKKAATVMRSEPGLDIGSAAARCGFSDPNYFARQFKRRYGMSPRQWRKANQAGSRALFDKLDS